MLLVTDNTNTEYTYAYETALRNIRDNGIVKTDRTGTGTTSLFGLQMRFDLTQGFPLLTTKKVFTKGIVHELIWFLNGETNIKYLQENGVKIWDDWADENSDLGPIYGYQWRSWPGKIMQRSLHGVDKDWYPLVDGEQSPCETHQESIDQIAKVVQRIKDKPDDRRLLVSAWNPAQIDEMKLPPCHCLFQFYTRPLTVEQRHVLWTNSIDADVKVGPDWECLNAYWVNYQESLVNGIDVEGHRQGLDADLDSYGIPSRYLDCQLYQRSADFFLGVPFNIASYALLTSMVAQQCNMVPGEFVWTGGDCHIYSNHKEQVDLQLSRIGYSYPTLVLNKAASIFDYTYEDVKIIGYESHPAILAPIAV